MISDKISVGSSHLTATSLSSNQRKNSTLSAENPPFLKEISNPSFYYFRMLVVSIFALVILTSCTYRPASSSLPRVQVEPLPPAQTETLNAEQQIESKLSTLLKRPVEIHLDNHKAYRNWRFLIGHPVNPDGSRIDIEGTPFQADYQEGYFEDLFLALTQMQPGSETDELIHFSYGATDAAFISWAEEYNLPMCLFSFEQPCEPN